MGALNLRWSWVRAGAIHRSDEFQIAPDAAELGALQGRIPEYFFKTLFRQFLPFRPAEVQYGGNRRKSIFLGRGGEPVPRTDILANIAAEYPVVEAPLHRIRDQQILQLDGEIRNAFAAIHHFVFPDGP